MRTIKRRLKKAFTITELVIVIAIIGILIAVLIPTFSNVIQNAHKSKALQQSNNALKEYLALVLEDGDTSAADGIVFVSDGYAHVYINSALHYIGETDDMPYIGTDGSLRNVSNANEVGIAGIGITAGKGDDSTAVVLNKAHTIGSNPDQVIGFRSLGAVTDEADPLYGKTIENLYFYETTVNGTDYVGYFTLESGAGRFRLEETNYSRMSGIVPATSAENPDDYGINLAYKSIVTDIDLYERVNNVDTMLGSQMLISRKGDHKMTLVAKADKAGATVKWTTSNEKIATISAKEGETTEVTVKAAGTVTITATCDGITASVLLSISNPSATVTTEKQMFGTGFATTVYATAEGVDAFDKIVVSNVLPADGAVTYVSNRTATATVDTDGTINVVGGTEAEGTATITVRVNGVSVQTITLTVEKPAAEATIDNAAFNAETDTLAVTSSAEVQTFQIDVAGKAPETGTVDYVTPEGTTVSVDATGKITVAANAAAGTHKIDIRVDGIVVDTITVSVTAA